MEYKIPYLVAITGCIGSGKTTISNYLGDRGFDVIYADDLSRKYLYDKEVITYLKIIIDNKIKIMKGNLLDFKSIGKFFDKNPLHEIKFEEWFQLFLGKRIMLELLSYKTSVIFCDIPLLRKKGIEDIFDEIWLVKTDKQVSISRILKLNGYNANKINFMINFSTAEYDSEKTFYFYNNSDKKNLFLQVDLALNRIPFKFFSNSP